MQVVFLILNPVWIFVLFKKQFWDQKYGNLT
ncbi:hypothetical protein GLDPPO_GLDPPO_09235, partial [Dysosmobacter welbionis]